MSVVESGRSSAALPGWIESLPASARAFRGLETRLLYGSPRGEALFVYAAEDTEVPKHAHQGQWGVVFEGSLELAIGDGPPRRFAAGDTYNIPAGVEHGGSMRAGTRLVEFFEDPEWHTPEGGAV